MIGHFELSWPFLTSLMSIVFIDLMLAGDNAVVIAMAVNSLPERTRRWGIFFKFLVFAYLFLLLAICCIPPTLTMREEMAKSSPSAWAAGRIFPWWRRRWSR